MSRYEPEHPNSRPKYLPTPEQIAAECKAIRATWSEHTERTRLGIEHEPTWEVPVVGESK